MNHGKQTPEELSEIQEFWRTESVFGMLNKTKTQV
jgi:hypothetical protein